MSYVNVFKKKYKDHSPHFLSCAKLPLNGGDHFVRVTTSIGDLQKTYET